MLHILLLLLKIIGIALLVLLGLILLILAVVLLVPLCYRVSLSKYTALAGEARVSWLFHLIEGIFTMDSGQEEGKRCHFRLRIACFYIYDNLKLKKEPEKKKRIKKKRVRKTKDRRELESGQPLERKDDGLAQIPAGKLPLEPEQSQIGKAKKSPETEQARIETEEKALEPERILKEPGKEPELSDEAEPDDGTEDGASHRKWFELPGRLWKLVKGFFNGILGFIRRILSIPGRISGALESLEEKMIFLRTKKERVLAIYHDEETQRWLKPFLRRVKKLLLRLLPRIDYLYGHFGFDDPSVTGKTLGMLSIFYPICGERMVLEPDFERVVIEGECRLHGHIQLLPIVTLAVRSFLNKRFFRIVKQVKNI